MYILPLEKLGRESRGVGEKAANLGEMIMAGFPVPPGFAITSEAFERFIAANNMRSQLQGMLEGLDHGNLDSLVEKSREIARLISAGRLPDSIEREVKDAYEELSVGKEVKALGGTALDFVKAGRETVVAVRASAPGRNAGLAGQKSMLNVQGTQALLQAIKEVWSGAYSPTAMFYRSLHSIPDEPLAVVVQKMVDSEKSGVIFTADPFNGSAKVIIEAGWGLGNAVVSGLVTPDHYVVDKETGSLERKKLGRKRVMFVRDPAGFTSKRNVPLDRAEEQVLYEQELRKLWELSRRLEIHNGRPQDIEWCIDRNRVFVVQSRPLVVSDSQRPEDRVLGQELFEGLAASPGLGKGGVSIVDEFNAKGAGGIVVAKSLSMDMMPYLKDASALVSDEGGLTSHVAKVSREMKIPYVIGSRASSMLKPGQEVVVDAFAGKVYAKLVPQVVYVEPEPLSQDAAAPEPEPHEEVEEFTATEIMASITADFPPGLVEKSDGVGMLNIKNLLTESGRHPYALARENPEELVRMVEEGVRSVAKAFYPKPVWYRLLDARTDELRNLQGSEESEEANPLLGFRGIRRSLEEPAVLNCELEALKKLWEEGLTNIGILLPFVSKPEELRKAREAAKAFVPDAAVGIMVETPAAALNIEAFCKEGSDFVLINASELAQLTLGIDRGNMKVADSYSEADPAVLGLIENVVSTCKGYKVKVSITGEVATTQQLAERLVAWGVDSVSVEPDSLDRIKAVVGRVERRTLLDKLRRG